MSKRAEQGRATRELLIETATRLFAERGYEDTSIETVLEVTGVSRGALYHHFNGKDALFEAVLGAVENRIIAELGGVIAEAPDGVSTLRMAALAWIDLAGDPVIQRIVLIDAPAVLGWERWRAMDDGSTLGAMRAIMQRVSDEGHLAPHLVDAFAHMVLAALDELAVVIARSDDPQRAMAEGREAVEELLRRLLTP